MIILDKFKTEKVKHRKQLDLRLIVHMSTIKKEKIKYEDNLLKQWIALKESVDKKTNGYFSMRNFWKSVFKQIKKVKVDNRLKLGEYYVFKNTNFFLKVRNPDRFKTQIIELCYR